MKRVDLDRVTARDLRDAAVRRKRDRVCRLGGGLTLTVDDLLADVRKVLHERATTRDVQDLHAAADGEDRKPAPPRRAHETQLEDVDLRLRGPKLRVRTGAVTGGLEVGTAGQADTVEPVDDRLEPPRGQRREDHGDAAGGLYRFQVTQSERQHPPRRLRLVREMGTLGLPQL